MEAGGGSTIFGGGAGMVDHPPKVVDPVPIKTIKLAFMCSSNFGGRAGTPGREKGPLIRKKAQEHVLLGEFVGSFVKAAPL